MSKSGKHFIAYFIVKIWWNDSIPCSYTNYYFCPRWGREVMVDQSIMFHRPNKKEERKTSEFIFRIFSKDLSCFQGLLFCPKGTRGGEEERSSGKWTWGLDCIGEQVGLGDWRHSHARPIHLYLNVIFFICFFLKLWLMLSLEKSKPMDDDLDKMKNNDIFSTI